jgi:arylsulfatase A-like enzyme
MMKMAPLNVIPAKAGIQQDAMECVPPKVFFLRSPYLMRHFPLLITLILVFHLTALLPEKTYAEKRPPNFIIIFIDDLGYGDLGCYGAPKIKTPNLDRMAAEGIRFTNFYSCAAVCTPSRAGLLTGRYPIRSGLNYVLFPLSTGGIEDTEMTLAETLMGHLPQYLPTRHGFDTWFGLPYSNDMIPGKWGYPPLPLMRDEAILEAPADQDTLTKRYTEESIRFIENHQAHPFFLYLAHTMVHVPLHVSKEFAGHSSQGLYGDAVEEVDWSVGAILAALKRLNLEENTLVVFTSDNGPWLVKKEHGGSAGPLRQGKGTTFEGGIREPAIFRWTGQIPAGKTTDEPAITLDLFPTFLQLAGRQIPADRPLDGKDISQVLTGTGHRADHRFFFFLQAELQAFRSDAWKLKKAFPGNAPNAPEDHPTLLFNLEQDPSESQNLAEQYPDKVREMEKEMQEFVNSLGTVPESKR